MSELKVIKIELNNHGKPIASIQGTTSYYGISPNDTFYPKSEADKVIEDLEESHKKEVGQLLMEIAEQKSEIERLEILCANYRHDCDNLAISNEQVKRAASTLLKKMNHNKYKRCLAMAKWCYDRWIRAYLSNKIDKTRFYVRWHKRWLKIAQKFKEAK